MRIRARAIQRCGQLLQEFATVRGERTDLELPATGGPKLSKEFASQQGAPSQKRRKRRPSGRGFRKDAEKKVRQNCLTLIKATPHDPLGQNCSHGEQGRAGGGDKRAGGAKLPHLKQKASVSQNAQEPRTHSPGRVATPTDHQSLATPERIALPGARRATSATASGNGSKNCQLLVQQSATARLRYGAF